MLKCSQASYTAIEGSNASVQGELDNTDNINAFCNLAFEVTHYSFLLGRIC